MATVQPKHRARKPDWCDSVIDVTKPRRKWEAPVTDADRRKHALLRDIELKREGLEVLDQIADPLFPW